MSTNTFKNDALREEFIRSVFRNVAGDRDSAFAERVLFAFIKGSARSPLSQDDTNQLCAWLRDVTTRCAVAGGCPESAAGAVTALAKHLAENEAVPMAAVLQAAREACKALDCDHVL